MTETPQSPNEPRKPPAAQPRAAKKATPKPAQRAAAPEQPRTETAEAAATAAEPVAATAHEAPPARPEPAAALRSLSEIRHFFRTCDVPVFFVGATPFNLLGLDRWVRGLSYITYYDGWNGAHPRVFTPSYKPYVDFASSEEINNWLLTNAEVQAHVAAATPAGVRPKIAMAFANQETEKICTDLGYDLVQPPAELRSDLQAKLVSTGAAGKVAVVPRVTTGVRSWDELVRAAAKADLGSDLVVKTAEDSDSRKGVYLIASEEDWHRHAEDISGHPEVTVMRREAYHAAAVEAVLTKKGIVVGPCMTGLTGRPELTPDADGWCGDEMHPDVVNGEIQAKASQLVQHVGDWLEAEGYRGLFEVDVLLDAERGEVYASELNLGITAATALTNLSAGAYADLPLVLFHLLDSLEVDIDLDVKEVNGRWQRLAAQDEWSLVVIKETAPIFEHIERAAPTGQYTLDENGELVFRNAALDWHQLQNEQEAFFLSIYGAGDYRWSGADLGVLVTRGRIRVGAGDEPDALTSRARHMIDSIRAYYSGTPVALAS